MTGLREKQRKSRHSSILEAARQLFRAGDYQAVTIEAIARDAQLSPMTVFNYFGSKGGLLLALVNQSDLLLVEKIEKHIRQDHTDAIESIRQFSFIIVDHAFSYLDRKTWRHVHATAILEGHSTFARGFLALEKDLVKLMCKLLNVLESTGLVLVDEDTMTVANIIYNVHNARFIEYASSDDFSTDQIKDTISSDLQCLTRLMLQPATARL